MIKVAKKLLPAAIEAFPFHHAHVYYKDVTTADSGVTGKATVAVFPNADSWENLTVALRGDWVVEVAVSHYGQNPDLPQHVTGRHTAPKRFARMSKQELHTVVRFLKQIIARPV